MPERRPVDHSIENNHDVIISFDKRLWLMDGTVDRTIDWSYQKSTCAMNWKLLIANLTTAQQLSTENGDLKNEILPWFEIE